MNANITTIVGRLAAKPQLKGYKKKDGSDGFRGFMRVAVTRLGDLGKPREERRTNFCPVVSWGALAQRCAQHLDTGTEVTVVGELIAESQVITDAQGQPVLDANGKKQYREFIHIQANSVQFGRRSMKNASQGDLASQVAALQARMDAAAGGHGTPAPAETPASTPASTPAEGENPFDTPAAASA